jgi:hypothetical protein
MTSVDDTINANVIEEHTEYGSHPGVEPTDDTTGGV